MIEARTIGLGSTHGVLIGAREFPPPALQILRQFPNLDSVVLIGSADAGINSGSHSPLLNVSDADRV
jgi:hypothetical protein